VPSRIAFSTLAFPDATLAAAVFAGRRWGYSGVELRLIDGELIDPALPAARRAQVRRTLAAAALPVVAVDSSIRLTGDDPGPDLRRFLQLASAVWDSHHPHRMGETPAEVYANLGPRVLLAQVKDARRIPDGDWRLVLLGAGEVPVREMLGLLAAGGYPHWISVEWEKRWHPEIEDPEVALPQHLDLLTAWLESDL
jgi:sugar phosphate isomerase/epimerase